VWPAGPVAVTTVVPGLMCTGSHLQARFTGRRDQEFTWFALAASLPLVSMDAERAAHWVVEAMRARRAEVILTPAAQIAARAAGIIPEFTSVALHLFQHLLLPAPADHNNGSVPGKELHPVLNADVFGWLTILGRSATRRFNQVPLRFSSGSEEVHDDL
jgi:hypothetical protein